MKFVKRSSLYVLFVLSVLWISPLQARTFKIDPSHTNIGFEISHLVIATVEGRFDKFEGTFDFDEQSGKLNNLSVEIDSTSINTNEPDRDKHLRSDDFFKTATNPKLTFKSTQVDYNGNKPHKIHGELTMAGVTQPVTLDVNYKGLVNDPWGNEKLVFDAKTVINRKQWGINWNKTLDKGGLAVGEDVTIIIKGQAMRSTE